jgi:hypothetical protein
VILAWAGFGTLLINPLVAEAESRSKELHEVARTMWLRLLSLSVNNDHDFATAFAAIAKHKPCALFRQQTRPNRCSGSTTSDSCTYAW